MTSKPKPGEWWRKITTDEQVLILEPLGQCVRVQFPDGHESEFSPAAAEALLDGPINHTEAR